MTNILRDVDSVGTTSGQTEISLVGNAVTLRTLGADRLVINASGASLPTGNMVIANGSLVVSGTITAADPTLDTHVATRRWVENLSSKQSVRVATTANLNLSSPGSSIDGVTLSVGNRVLVKDQTTQAQNGIYIWNGAAVAMTRASDGDAWSDLVAATVGVEEGTANANTTWFSTSTATGTLGTTAIVWQLVSNPRLATLGTITPTNNTVVAFNGTTVTTRPIGVAAATDLLDRAAGDGRYVTLATASTMSGALTVTNATASTSTTTGAVVVTGGVGIGGAIHVGGASSDAIVLNTGGSWIRWPNASAAAPATTTRSAGTRLVLWPQVNASSADYALGIASNTLWLSVPTSTQQFQFYAATAVVTTISGTGAISASSLALSASTASTNTTTGALTVAGGVGIGGDVNVGGNLSLTGNLTVNGTTTTFNSTTVTVDDPVFTLGGNTAPASDDNLDRGIEFRWHNGTTAQLGFLGFRDSNQRLVYIPSATNTSGVYSGSVGTIEANLVSRTFAIQGGDAVPSSAPTTSVDWSGNVTIPLSLSNTGVTAGTYLVSVVNAQGRVTSASNSSPNALTITTGTNATSTSTGSLILSGSGGAGIGGNLYVGGTTVVGTGDGTGTVSTGSIRAPNASGTNIAGAALQLSGGASTGSATGGAVQILVAAAGTSGTAANGPQQIAQFNGFGNVIFGFGHQSATPDEATVLAPNGTGTNIVGGTLKLAAGNGTGSGGSGNIELQTSAPGSSGTTSNTRVTRVTITPSGRVDVATDLTTGTLRIGSTTPSTLALDASVKTDGMAMPSGTTAQRPGTRPAGTLRYNTDLGVGEMWDGSQWRVVSRAVTVATSAPANPQNGDLWFDSRVAQLFVSYNDGDSTQWVAAGGAAAFLPLYGGTLSGPLAVQADATVRSLNSGPLGGLRNSVMNGDFRVHQRGTSSVTGGFVVDRWLIASVNGSRTAQRVALTDSDRAFIGRGDALWCLQYAATGGSGTGDQEILRHNIEGVRSLTGRTVTVSFWARRTAGSGNIGTEFVQVFGTGGSPSANVSGIGSTQHVMSSSWQRYSATASIPTGGTLGTNGDDYLAVNFWLSAGSTLSTRAGGIGVQTGTFQITDVQVEIGAEATPFEFRPLQQELALCQRYYWNTFPNGVAAAQNAGTGGALFFSQSTGASTNGAYGPFFLPVTMRAVPTITTFNPSAANAQIRNNSTSTDFTVTTATAISVQYFSVTATSPASSSAGQGCWLHAAASAEF